MRLQRWGQLATWSVFALVVYFPVGRLVLEVVFPGDGGDLMPLPTAFLTDSHWGLLGTSLLLALGTSILALAIGVPYAFLCAKTDLPGRSFFSIAYIVPLLIPPYMQAIVWGRLLSNNGPLNRFLVEHLGLSVAPFDVHSVGGAIFVLALAYFPFVTLLTLSGLKTVDRQYEEAALLQRGFFGALVRVTLPMVRPQVAAAALFVLVFAIIDFGVPDILRVQVYPVEIFIQFSALYDERAAILLSVPLVAITVLAIGLQVRTMRGRSYISFQAGQGGMLRHRLGPIRFAALSFCLVVLGLAVFVPVAALLETAGSIQTFIKAIGPSADQILVSFALAGLAAALMTALAVAVAVAIYSAKGRWRTVTEYLSQIPFAIPPIVLGIGLIKLWNRPATDWLYTTPLIVVLGYMAHFVPFAVRALYANLQQMSPRLVEAGRLAGRSGFAVVWRIALPLLRNGLLTGFFIAFVLAMGELGVTLLVSPPGTATIPIKIYNFMHYGAEATVAALCLILMASQLVFAAFLFGLGRWLGRGAI